MIFFDLQFEFYQRPPTFLERYTPSVFGICRNAEEKLVRVRAGECSVGCLGVVLLVGQGLSRAASICRQVSVHRRLAGSMRVK